MVRKALSAVVLATGLVFLSSPVWALGVFHQRMAAAEIPAGSNCTRVTNAIPSGAPYTAIRCPTTGGSFNLNLTVPTDGTGTFQGRIHFLSPDSGPSGNACTQVCYGVVKGTQSRNNLNLTACQLPQSRSVPAQYVEDDPGFAAISVTAKDVSGGTCGADCAGAELVIQFTRLTGGSCSSNSAQNIDYLFDSEQYQ